MKKIQLKNELTYTLHQLVHLRPHSFSNGFHVIKHTDIYVGLMPEEIHRIGWVSESSPRTVFIKELPNKHRYRKAERIIVKYAKTPLKKRCTRFVVLVGMNCDGSLAMYSRNDGKIHNVFPRFASKISAYYFTENEFESMCEYLPEMFKKMAQNGKIPLSELPVICKRCGL